MKTLLPFFALTLLSALFAPGPAARADDEPKPLATAKHPLGLTVEVLTVSVDDTQNKLKVTWRYTNPTKKPIRLVEGAGPFPAPRAEVPWVQYWDEVNYRAGKLDDDKAARYPVVETKDRKYVDATDIRKRGIEVPAGGSFEMYAKFPKPENGETVIHLQLPELPQFEKLPVSDAKK